MRMACAWHENWLVAYKLLPLSECKLRRGTARKPNVVISSAVRRGKETEVLLLLDNNVYYGR
jgi:hypothetical protein